MRATFPNTAWTSFTNLPDGALDQRLPYLARRLHARGEGALQNFLTALLKHQMPTQFAIAAALEHPDRFDPRVIASELEPLENEACDDVGEFSINTQTQIFNCRGCGAKGDVIDFVEFVTGCSSIEACELITGTPRPNGTRDETFDERDARLAKNAARLGALQQHDAEAIEHAAFDLESSPVLAVASEALEDDAP